MTFCCHVDYIVLLNGFLVLAIREMINVGDDKHDRNLIKWSSVLK